MALVLTMLQTAPSAVLAAQPLPPPTSIKILSGTAKDHLYLIKYLVKGPDDTGSIYLKIWDEQKKSVWSAKVPLKHKNSEGVCTVNTDALGNGRYTCQLLTSFIGYQGFAVSKKWPLLVRQNSTCNLTDNGMCRWRQDGVLGHRFEFAYTGAKGKTISWEIYNAESQMLKKDSFKPRYNKGSYLLYWDYYTDDGTRIPSGSYSLRYRISGGNWQLQVFNVNFGGDRS